MQTMNKRSRWRTLLVLALVAIAAIAAFVAYQRNKAKPEYMTARASLGDIETTVLASGTVESANLVSVGAQVSGQLKSLKVELGDTVKAGQLVAEIDSLPQQNTLRTKTAALDVVRAQRQAKEAALRQAELAFKRQEQMFKGDAGSREDYENAEASLNVVRAEIAALEAQSEQARIAVDTARLDLGYTRITSPIDGVVVAIVTKEGQTVNANQSAPTIIKVARLDRMTIKVEISEADVVRVKPGQKVAFTILGEPDNRYPAELRSIEPAPESVASESTASAASTTSSSGAAIYYMGLLDVPNAEGKLRINMTAQVYITLEEARGVLTIPAAALGDKDDEGRFRVRVAGEKGMIEDRWVRIGLNNNVRTEIREGLRQGEQVVIGEQTNASAATSSTSPRRRMPPPGMM